MSERIPEPSRRNGWEPTAGLPDGVRHFSAQHVHVFDIQSRPEFHPSAIKAKASELERQFREKKLTAEQFEAEVRKVEPFQGLREAIQEYIHKKTGIRVTDLQYDPIAAIVETLTNAMVHAHNYDGRTVRLILRITKPVSTVASRPQVLAVKVWDQGQEGFPKDIRQRIKRQEGKVEQADRELEETKAKIQAHENAIKDHESELSGLSKENPAHRLRMAALKRMIERRNGWLMGHRLRELDNLGDRLQMWGAAGTKDTSAGTGGGLYLIRKMTSQRHYGEKWGRLEFNDLTDEDVRPYRNEVYMKIPLIRMGRGFKADSE